MFKCNRVKASKLQGFTDKSIILKNVNRLKGSDFHINKDFSGKTTELRKKLWEEVRQLLSNDILLYLNYCLVIARNQAKI